MPVDSATVESVVPLARSLAYRAARNCGIMPADDFVSDALYGLAKAAARCDRDRPFLPYAKAMIDGAILHGMRDRAGRYTKNPRPKLMALDATGSDGDEPYLHASLPDRHAVDPHGAAVDAELWALVDRTLTRRNALIVRLHYQRGLSTRHLGRLFGVSQMQISRVVRQAHVLLRDEFAVSLAEHGEPIAPR